MIQETSTDHPYGDLRADRDIEYVIRKEGLATFNADDVSRLIDAAPPGASLIVDIKEPIERAQCLFMMVPREQEANAKSTGIIPPSLDAPTGEQFEFDAGRFRIQRYPLSESTIRLSKAADELG